MSLARLVVTAVRLEGRSKSAVARDYGVSRRWVHELVRRFETQGVAWRRVRPVPVMSIVLAAYLVRLVVGYQVPTAVQFASAPAWLRRPLVLISKAHEDAEPRAFQRRLEDAGFRVRIDEGPLCAGDSLIAAIATAILEMERTIPVWV